MSKALLAAAFVAVSASGALADANDLALCRQLADAWKAAFNAHDAAKVASLYDPDAGLYSNPFWTGAGRDALQRGLKADFAMDGKYDAITCDKADHSGTLLNARGTFSGSAKGSNGQAMPMGGHWFASAHDTGGGAYLIVTHNANVQLPPPK